MSRRAVLCSGAAVLTAAILPGCARNLPEVRIAAGEPGGSYHQFAELLAQVAVERNVARHVEVVTTAGSVSNISLVSHDQVDLAMSLIDAAAVDPTRFVALGRVYQNYLQCLVLTDSQIHTVADLAGRTVSVGALTSGTAYTAKLVLNALDLMDLRRVHLSLGEAVTALGTGKVDAMLWSGGIPVPEAERLGKHRIRLIDPTAALGRLDVDHPGLYHRTLVPPGVYANRAPTATIGIASLLLCRRALDDTLAAALVDLLIDDARRLVPGASAGIQHLTAASLIDTAPIELHPAALRRYAARSR